MRLPVRNSPRFSEVIEAPPAGLPKTDKGKEGQGTQHGATNVNQGASLVKQQSMLFALNCTM